MTTDVITYTPADIVREIYEASADVREAANRLEEEAKRNTQLYQYLVAPYLSRACYEAITRACRKERQVVWAPPVYRKTSVTERKRENANYQLMNFPLPGGKRLQLANAAEVRDAAMFYNKQAVDMSGKAKWLAAIAERIGDKTVGEALTEQDLQDMRE